MLQFSKWPTSEEIFERELHNSRVLSRCNLPEISRIEIRHRIVKTNRISNVERFGSKLHLFRFTKLERSRQSDIKLPCSRSQNGRLPEVSQCSKRGHGKSGSVQVAARCLISIRGRF